MYSQNLPVGPMLQKIQVDEQQEAREQERYKRRRHTRTSVLLWTCSEGDEVRNPIPGRIEDGLVGSSSGYLYPYGTVERQTFSYDFPQCLAIIWIFSNRFAKVEGLASPVVHRQRQMMRSDRTCDGRTTRFYSLNGCPSRSMLKDNSQLGKCRVDLKQMG